MVHQSCHTPHCALKALSDPELTNDPLPNPDPFENDLLPDSDPDPDVYYALEPVLLTNEPLSTLLRSMRLVRLRQQKAVPQRFYRTLIDTNVLCQNQLLHELIGPAAKEYILEESE